MNEDLAKGAAARLGISNENGDARVTGGSIFKSFGGWTGIVEVTLPGLVFLATFTLGQNLVWSVVAASAVAIGFILRQLFKKRPPTQAVAGLFGVVISAIFPLRPGGQPVDFYAFSILKNSLYLAGLLLSVLVRWPLIGILAGFFLGHGTKWRTNKRELRRLSLATLLFSMMFAIRLVIQIPLYLAGDAISLGLAAIPLGYPLYAITIWFSWLVIRPIFNKTSEVA